MTTGVTAKLAGRALALAAVWALGGAVLAVTGWACWSASAPRAWPYGAFSVLVALFLLYVLWGVAVAGWLATGRRHPWRWLLVAPLASVLLLTAAANDLPLRARWSLARPAFEHVIAAQPAPGPGRVGGFQLDGAEPYGDGWLFYLNIDSTKDAAAFGYLPHGPAGLPGLAKSGENSYVNLGGGWYLVASQG